MASRYQITILVLAGLLFGGLVLAQDTESAEEVESTPGEQAAGGDAESEEGGAAAPVGTGEEAEGTDGGTGVQGNNPFFAGGEQQAGEPAEVAGTGDGDAESNEAGGTALEANAEQNDAEEEEPEAAEVEEAEEAEAAETEAQEVDLVKEAENSMTPTKSTWPLFNINDPQKQAAAGEGAEMESGEEEQGAAELGGEADESGEEAESGAAGAAQNADGEAESGEEESAAEQEQESETESSDAETNSATSVDGEGPSPSPGAPLIEEVEEEEEEQESEGSSKSTFEKPNLFFNPLSDKAKQVGDGKTTAKPEDAIPTPGTDEEKTEAPSGLSDSDKTRIIISTSAVGAVVFVGVVAYLIGRNVSRRPHVSADP